MMLMKAVGRMLIQVIKMDKAEHFFEKIEKSSLEAISQERIELYYCIAGYNIKLVFAGAALIPFITPAIEHLRSDASEKVDLTIYLWDSVSTGIAIPPNEWGTNDYLKHGLIRGYNTENISTTFNVDSGTLNIYRREDNSALFWVRDAMQLPYYEIVAPLRDIFSWWASQHGLQYVHAAAIGSEDGAVLVVGKGGSGKSTSALSCFMHPDLFYIGDDYALISNDAIPYVYSLYNSTKLNADHAVNFPDLLKHASNLGRLDTEKTFLFIQDIYPNKIVRSMPLRGIILPQVTGLPSSSYSSASSSLALRAWAPSSMFQLPGSSESTFSYFSRFVRKLPAYTLHAGTHYNEIPEVILSILKDQRHAK